MLVCMTVDALARSTDRPRTLACNRDGIWLWPGLPLVEPRGSTFVALPKSAIYNRVAKLHGPSAIYSAVVPCVEQAATLLSSGQIEKAQQALDRARLPLVTPDGALLMRAVGRRLGIAPPVVALGDEPRRWTADDIELFARHLASTVTARSSELTKLFNPAA